MAKSLILKKKKYSLKKIKNQEKIHDFANLNQILDLDTVDQFVSFLFSFKDKQIPISWIFCMQCNVLVTLYCSTVDFFCADWSIDPGSVGTFWHVLQMMFLALTELIYYTGSWNTSTLCNKGKQVDQFSTANLLKFIVCHDMGLVVQLVALFAVFLPLLLLLHLDLRYIIHLQQLLPQLCKIRNTHNWYIYALEWKFLHSETQ